MDLNRKRASARSEVLTRDLQGQLVLLNVDTETYFGLDEIGTRFWAVLTTAPSVQAAVETLAQEYEGPPQEIESDVTRLLEQLAEEGLVDLVDV